MVKIEVEGNVITLRGPLAEIEKVVVVCRGDDGEVLNVALDDAILMNRTIYKINKPLLNERDKLKLDVAELIDIVGLSHVNKEEDCDCCECGDCCTVIELPTALLHILREHSESPYACADLFCPLCYPVPNCHR